MIVKQLKQELERFEEHETVILMIDELRYEVEQEVIKTVFELGGVDLVGAELRAKNAI